jgi:hypothetical protein
MYLGIDFLLEEDGTFYISEVNTGLPGGAREYDLVYRAIFKRPSGIFEKIDSISREIFSKPFKNYIREQASFDELKTLKIWMDGKGERPGIKAKNLRLEDKWVQYLILSQRFPMVRSELYDPGNTETYIQQIKKDGPLILKRRLGRGGKGFLEIREESLIKQVERSGLPKDFYIIQPYLKSEIKTNHKSYKLSVRVIVFAGNFICIFANLSEGPTSNHGIRFFIETESDIKKITIKDEDFKVWEVSEKAWEADIFFGYDIPPHLYHNLYDETIADTVINMPSSIYNDMIKTAISISRFYDLLDFNKLPRCYIEEASLSKFPDF